MHLPATVASVPRRAVLLVLAVLVAAGGAAGAYVATSGGHNAHASGAPRHTTGAKRAGPPGPATWLGPAGVQSAAIVAENRRPGTTAWQITSPGPPFIEGFADTTYAASGDRVGLYVSTTAASFHVVAYRMGWYHGAGAREIWTSPEVPGVAQPACPLTPGTNMVACDNWARSLTVAVTAAWPAGDYLLELVGSGGQQAYVLLVVWDPSSRATYLVMNRSLTEEGWNTYGGGYTFYGGHGDCPPGSGSYPPCNRARVVSFDRPFATGFGASDFLTLEYPLVQWAEEQGLDVTYASDVGIDAHPSFVGQHRALVSLGHDELWTYDERKGAEDAFDHGVNMIFLGSAAVLRHARLQASPLGPDQEEVDYRDSAADPLNGKGDPMQVTGNTWSSPPSSWPETRLVGQLYSGYLAPGTAPQPLVVFDASAWIFAGTGLQDGASVPGVIASDIDHLAPGSSGPSNIEVFAHSPLSLSDTYTNQGSWDGKTYSDMTYFTNPASKAGSFDAGTVQWIAQMADCPSSTTACAAPVLRTMMGNLFHLFGQGPAGTFSPPVPNAASVTPAGS